jgi:YesN/AraC family two-component response regulator
MEESVSRVTKIFIVDDEEDVRVLYERFLILNDFEVLPSAKNGKEAIEMFKNFNPKPDIILMDCLMPVLNGLEATKEILKINREANIIMISSDGTVGNKAIKLGAKRFLSKTASIARIIQAIKKLVEND